tara:strand:+ start:96 stop:602 length:507 start_codon:yes stop_codon:yes gene_type:complete
MKDELEQAQEELQEVKTKIQQFRSELLQNQINLKGEQTMINAYLITGLISLLVGGGSGALIVHKIHNSKEETPVQNEQVATGQIEVQLQLTDLDLLKIPCSDEYIEKHQSDLLCRELFCQMQTRGLDAQTAGSTCEEISNIANTLIILEHCKDTEEKEECFRLFRERK